MIRLVLEGGFHNRKDGGYVEVRDIKLDDVSFIETEAYGNGSAWIKNGDEDPEQRYYFDNNPGGEVVQVWDLRRVKDVEDDNWTWAGSRLTSLAGDL